MLSDRLKELRKKQNLTQVQFAKIFNISSGTIAMWETNKRTPDVEMLIEIANYFNVSLDYLLDNKKKIAEVERNTNNDLKFALFGNVEIDDEVLDEVRHYAKIAKQMREEQKRKNKIIQSENDDEEIEVFVAARSKDNKVMPTTKKMKKSEWERLKNLPETDDDF